MADQSKSELFHIEPRRRFQRSLKAPSDYKTLVGDPMIQDAVQDSLAQMVVDGFSRDELNGAAAFANIFLNLAEPEAAPVKLPIKRLSIQ